MTLKDPFSRLARRQQTEYALFRQSLKDSGLNSRTEAKALLANIQRRALVIASVVASLVAVTILFLPELKTMVIIFAVLALLWLFAITIKGQGFIHRYIKEECADEPDRSQRDDFRA